MQSRGKLCRDSTGRAGALQQQSKNTALMAQEMWQQAVPAASTPLIPSLKPDLARDGQIIQLREVSGMVIVPQPFCSLRASLQTLPLQGTLTTWEKEKGNRTISTKICPSGNGGLNGHNPQNGQIFK